jgi:oligoribonuclease
VCGGVFVKTIFFDIETNGLDPYLNVPLEIALICVEENKILFEYESVLRCSVENYILGSSPQALVTNGISWDDVKNAKPLEKASSDIIEFFLSHEIDRNNTVFISHNASFDKGFFYQIVSETTCEELNLPYHWLDLASMYFMFYYDWFRSQAYGRKKIDLSKNSLADFYELGDEENPHRALNGVKHLMLCYNKLMETLQNRD